LLRWLQLLLFTERHGESVPNPLLLLAAQRGRLLELMAERINQHDTGFRDRAFMTGILSLLDALLNQSLEEIVKQINLTSDVREALLEREGKLGCMLQLAEELERNDYEKVTQRIFQLGFSIGDLMQMRTEAMAWAATVAEGEAA
jgi:c-di-GMP-related signal transduction protein